MEIEKSPQEMAKKLWSIVRIVFHMLRKTIPKSLITLPLPTLLKRGKFAISNLFLHHRRRYYSALTCRSTDITATFISPQPYEFSCSSSPAATAVPPSSSSTRRRRRLQYKPTSSQTWNNQHDDIQVSSPFLGLGAPESPSSATTAEVMMRNQVDKDAEEFIRKFYRELKNQRRIAALESPSPPPLQLWGR